MGANILFDNGDIRLSTRTLRPICSVGATTIHDSLRRRILRRVDRTTLVNRLIADTNVRHRASVNGQRYV